MKKYLAALAIIMSLFTSSIYAQEISTKGYNVANCSMWVYEPDVVGWVCRTQPRKLEVASLEDARMLLARIETLEETIETLKARLDALEGQQ